MIKENLQAVQTNIYAACKAVGRPVDSVTLIAVSKTKPPEMISEAIAAGQLVFGENKPQELRDKYELFAEKKELQWHMIGNLQKNKIKYVVGTAVLIHSVDSLELARAISEEAEKKHLVCDILLEVNIANEPTKHGFQEEILWNQLPELEQLPHIRLRGLMTVAPYTENPEENRHYFAKMKQLLIDIKSKTHDNSYMDILSMGMTSDYQVAIEEGATMVRVGTGIFGERTYPL